MVELLVNMQRVEDLAGKPYYTSTERVVHPYQIIKDGKPTFYGLTYLTSDRFSFFGSLANSATELTVGQDEHRKQLADFIINAPDGSFATVTGPFGSGKTA